MFTARGWVYIIAIHVIAFLLGACIAASILTP